MEASSLQQPSFARMGVLVLLGAAIAFPGPVQARLLGPESTPLPATPSANGESDDIRRARELAANGRALYAEESYPAAVEAFEIAYDLAKDPNLLYNIAICHEKAGDLAVAADALDRYRAVAPEAERAGLVKRSAALRARANARVEPDPPPKPDPKETPPPVDPGPAAPETPRLFNPTAWALLGVSIVSVGLGTTFGVLSLRNGRDVDQSCTTVDQTLCPTSTTDRLRAARWQAAAADVSFVVGAGAAIGLAVVLAVRARKRKSAVAIVPTLGGLAVGGTFGRTGSSRRAFR